MIALFIIETYLMIGAFIALLLWSSQDKGEFANNTINGLAFMSVIVFWPSVFAFFVRVLRKKLRERRR